MRIQRLLVVIGASAAFATALHAQEPSTEPKKPGGLNKVAHDVSKTSKKAGRDVKETAKKASSDTHEVLTKAGNDTKAKAKSTTGYTSPKYDSTHKPGGVNKVARDISHVSKETGAKTKNGVKKVASKTHNELTDAGKATKDTLKKVKPPM